MAKLPAFQFYPADWKKDIKVQSLSFEERGIWFEILCLMHESEERGKLMINKKPMDNISISRLIGCELPMLEKALNRILELGVAYKDKHGVIYNKRMINDEKIIKIRRKSGKKGGNPALGNGNTGAASSGLLNQSSNQSAKQNPTPSASAASSSSTSDISSKQIFEYLRQATPLSISNRQIWDEVERFTKKYEGVQIRNLRAMCNTWANNLKPEVRRLVI